MTKTDQDLRTALEAKAEEQVAYWRKRQAAEKALEEGLSEDGETYTPIGDQAAWQSGYCNGRMSEADWWLSTLKYATPAQAPDKAVEREELKVVADALAKADGWEDPDALWTDNVGVISRGGKGDPVWTQYAETAALVLAALAPKPTGTEAGRGVGAASDGWLYHNPDTGTEWSVSHPVESGEVHDAENIRPATLDAFREEMFAAWKMLEEARQERDAATPTPPVSPTPDSTGPAGTEDDKPISEWTIESLLKEHSAAERMAEMGYEMSSEQHSRLEALTAELKRRHDQTAALIPSAPIAAPVRDDGTSIFPQGAGTGTYFRRLPDKSWVMLNSSSQWVTVPGFTATPASLPTPASDVPGEAQTQKGGR